MNFGFRTLALLPLRALAILVVVAVAPGFARAAEPTRVAVLRAQGASGDVAPIEAALRDVPTLRVVGPVDRPAPRASREVRALGESLDVALFVVLSDEDGATVLRVFEVRRGAYFEGTLAAPFAPDAVREFVSSRARVSHRGNDAPAAREGGSNLRLWAGLGVAVVAAGAFAALVAFGGSDDAPSTVRVDVVR